MRGRKPNPMHLQAIAGGASGGPGASAGGGERKDGAARSVNVEVAEPFCPEPVRENADAREIWDRLAELMVGAGLLAPIFEGTLACYCIAYGRLVEAERKLREAGAGKVTGWLIKSPNGYPIHSPYLAIANKAMEQMRAFGGELGLSPVALTRATRVGGQLDLFDDFEAFLNGRAGA